MVVCMSIHFFAVTICGILIFMKRTHVFFTAFLVICLILVPGSRIARAETSLVQQPFLRNLRLGATGDDVNRLQEYLNNHGAPVALFGSGSPGNETQYYGPATAHAVSHFQELHADVILTPSHLTKGTGSFYTATRNFVNQNLGQMLVPFKNRNGSNQSILSGSITHGSKRKYTIGGNISGLSGTVILQNNGSDDISISADGSFTFANSIEKGTSYNVTVLQQPEGQVCFVTNGDGTVNGSNVTSISISCTVALVSITITPSNSRLPSGINEQFIATGHYADSSTVDITASVIWDTSNHTVANINETGLGTGISAGMTQVYATLDGVTGATNLTVTDATLISVAISPLNPAVARGATLQLSAIGTFSDASTVDITNQTNWTSASTDIVTINDTDHKGMATGVAGGSTSIHANLNSITGTVTLHVGS